MITSEMQAEINRPTMMRWTRNDTAFVLILALTALGAGYLYHGFAFDDAFITYRYARNIVEGQGFTYNPGQWVLGTTTPLYTLVLATLGLLWPDFPTLSHVISTVALAGCGIFVYLLGRELNQRMIGFTASLILITNPLVLSTFGMETMFLMMLLMAAVTSYTAKYLNWASLALALATVTRADATLMVAVLGGDYILQRRRLPLRQIGLYLAVTLPWFAFSLLAFGSPLPNSVAAKVSAASVPGAYSFLKGILLWGAVYQRRSGLYILFLPLSLLGIVQLRHAGRAWRLIVVWAALYVIAYTLLGAPTYAWYYAPLVSAGAITVALGLLFLFNFFHLLADRMRLTATTPILLTGLLLVLIIYGQTSSAIWSHQGQMLEPRVRLYQTASDWFLANSDEDASIAALEIGALGYYSRRRMIDLYGLVTPELVPYLSHGVEYTIEEALQRYEPDFIVDVPTESWVPIIATDWFKAAYRPVARISDQGVGPLTIYQRQD